MKGLTLPGNALEQARSFGFSDHFLSKDTGRWTTTGDGTATVAAERGGVIKVATTNVDNAETYLHSNAVFQQAAGKALQMEARVKFADATGAANVFVGMMSGVAADALVDNGGGPKADFSGFGFYKVDGGSNLWTAIASDGTDQIKKILDLSYASPKREAKPAASADYQTLRVCWIPKAGKLSDVLFYIDDVGVLELLDVTWNTAALMAACVGVKAGSAAIQEVSVDYVYCYQSV